MIKGIGTTQGEGSEFLVAAPIRRLRSHRVPGMGSTICPLHVFSLLSRQLQNSLRDACTFQSQHNFFEAKHLVRKIVRLEFKGSIGKGLLRDVHLRIALPAKTTFSTAFPVASSVTFT